MQNFNNFDFNAWQSWVQQQIRETQQNIRVIEEADVERMLN